MGMVGSKGFTLLEVMIALSVLSIGLVAMLSVFSASHRVLTISDQTSLVAQLARNKMEGLRARHPLPMDEEEAVVGTGVTRKWSMAQSANDPRLWVITVSAFPTNEPTQSVLLKSLLFY